MISTWGDLIRALDSIHSLQTLRVLFPALALAPALVLLRSTLNSIVRVGTANRGASLLSPQRSAAAISESGKDPPSEIFPGGRGPPATALSAQSALSGPNGSKLYPQNRQDIQRQIHKRKRRRRGTEKLLASMGISRRREDAWYQRRPPRRLAVLRPCG